MIASAQELARALPPGPQAQAVSAAASKKATPSPTTGTRSLQARYHLLGNTRYLLHIGPGWSKHDGLDSGVKEALDPGGADFRGAKGAVGVNVKLRAVIGMGKCPELRMTALAVGADADVHELASVQSVGVFASRLGIATHFLPGLTKCLGGALTTSDPAVGFLGATLEYSLSPAPHEDRDTRLLQGFRLHADVIHVVVAAVKRHLWLGPQLPHDSQVFP